MKWKDILIPIDNSEVSEYAADIGIKIRYALNSIVTDVHIFDMAIHRKRFQVLMPQLSEEYNNPENYSRAFLGFKYYIMPSINMTAEFGMDMNNIDNKMFSIWIDADC